MVLKSFACISNWGPVMRKLGIDSEKENEKEYFSSLAAERAEDQLFEAASFWSEHVLHVR